MTLTCLRRCMEEPDCRAHLTGQAMAQRSGSGSATPHPSPVRQLRHEQGLQPPPMRGEDGLHSLRHGEVAVHDGALLLRCRADGILRSDTARLSDCLVLTPFRTGKSVRSTLEAYTCRRGR